MKRYIRIAWFFFELGLARIVAFFIKTVERRHKNIWLISERGDDARDNGFFFYKYLCLNHPERDVYYVISSNSPDFNRVKTCGRWIEYGSFKHYVFYCLSTIRISSSMWGGDLPKAAYFYKIRKFMSKKKKFVFLKHGIVKDYLPQHCVSNGTPDLYICGAKPEYDYVSAEFGHPKKNVVYTGLARFDNLYDKSTKNQILVMPTFRRWLQGIDEKSVSDSEYVKVYNDLLNNKQLCDMLEDKNVELIFYPHYVMQKNINLFNTHCDKIIIARFKDFDVQRLLIESKLLVTDYSSVFFDFGYMQKPVIYFQFDAEKYINQHYDFTKGYFNYARDGFGPVVKTNDELINKIIEMVNSGLSLEDFYKGRINKFFPLHDQNNCERIYCHIISMEEK